MKKIVLLIATLAILALPLTVLAGHGRGKGGCGCGGHGKKHGRGHGKMHGHKNPAMMKKMLKGAGLSEQQIRRIEALHLEAEKKMLDIEHELEKVRLDHRQLMQQYDAKKSEVFAQIDKIHAIKLRLKKARIGLRLDFRKEMTQEQWEKVRELRAEFKMKHHKKWGKQHPPVSE